MIYVGFQLILGILEYLFSQRCDTMEVVGVFQSAFYSESVRTQGPRAVRDMDA